MQDKASTYLINCHQFHIITHGLQFTRTSALISQDLGPLVHLCVLTQQSQWGNYRLPVCTTKSKGHPYENTLLRFRAKMHMYCIVLALRVEKSENTALPFSCERQICILSETMMPSPHSSTSSLQPLNPTASDNNNNNNNNNGLLLVFMFLATYSSCSQV